LIENRQLREENRFGATDRFRKGPVQRYTLVPSDGREATGNMAMVMRVMGHTDARTAMQYQHPVLDPIREAIDQRNLRHNSRQSELRVQ
jgi:hypothetical protein